MYLLRSAFIVLILGIFAAGAALATTQASFDVKIPKTRKSIKNASCVI